MDTIQEAVEQGQRDKAEKVASLLKDILDRATEELGEWDGIQYAHLPVAMNGFWYIQKYAEEALETLA